MKFVYKICSLLALKTIIGSSPLTTKERWLHTASKIMLYYLKIYPKKNGHQVIIRSSNKTLLISYSLSCGITKYQSKSSVTALILNK